MGDDAYVRYRRRDNAGDTAIPYAPPPERLINCWLVPYNPYLATKYNTYINVEICSGIKAVKYVYKYVYKGADMVSLRMSTAQPPRQP